MGLINDVLAHDSVAFTDADTFGESIVYTKRNGATRTINAVVDRDPMATAQEMTEGTVPKMDIAVANSVTTGVAASEWDNGDSFTVAYQLGRAAEKHYLSRAPLTQDAGMLHFRIG